MFIFIVSFFFLFCVDIQFKVPICTSYNLIALNRIVVSFLLFKTFIFSFFCTKMQYV